MKKQEGTFVEHTACPECGSNDNRAIYDNGDKMTYYCFGCEDTGILLDVDQVESKIKTQGDEFMNMRETSDYQVPLLPSNP